MNKNEIQSRVQSLSMENFEKFSEEQNLFFNNNEYEGFIPEKFAHYRQFSFAHRNEIQLGCTLEYWKYLGFGKLAEGLKYNLKDIITYLDSCQNLSLVDWIRYHGQNEKTFEDYMIFRESINKMGDDINPIIEAATVIMLDKLLMVQSAIVKPNSNSGNYKANKIINIGK